MAVLITLQLFLIVPSIAIPQIKFYNTEYIKLYFIYIIKNITINKILFVKSMHICNIYFKNKYGISFEIQLFIEVILKIVIYCVEILLIQIFCSKTNRFILNTSVLSQLQV